MKADGNWSYRLMWGTNRNKTAQEVKAEDVLSSVDELKIRLSRLAPGELVSWLVLEDDGLVIAPADLVDQIEDFCEERGIQLFGCIE